MAPKKRSPKRKSKRKSRKTRKSSKKKRATKKKSSKRSGGKKKTKRKRSWRKRRRGAKSSAQTPATKEEAKMVGSTLNKAGTAAGKGTDFKIPFNFHHIRLGNDFLRFDSVNKNTNR